MSRKIARGAQVAGGDPSLLGAEPPHRTISRVDRERLRAVWRCRPVLAAGLNVLGAGSKPLPHHTEREKKIPSSAVAQACLPPRCTRHGGIGPHERLDPRGQARVGLDILSDSHFRLELGSAEPTVCLPPARALPLYEPGGAPRAVETPTERKPRLLIRVRKSLDACSL